MKNKPVRSQPNPHHYHVMDVSLPVDPRFVAGFHSFAAAKEYALDISITQGAITTVRKGEYAR